ncbi:MAG: 16S rRNA (guanine(527)-N(7))-methyltransferase RsmG [unclassified Hahellaceae]|nr:16S rRNA (guanine(527)-N(7))-methyltransferase RsmG [Hahellaceae bacterium]|tara:strand:+ start:44780 stop:45457 length:678 start_codon:yes stop_codon:yes gene_type:complete
MQHRDTGSLLRSGVAQLGLSLSEDQIQLLLQYLGLLDRWNTAYNLTAVRDPREQVVRHLLDSLSVLSAFEDLQRSAPVRLTCLDVGTGAGIPGLILALVMPDTHWILLDSNGKKTRFLVQCCHTLGLNNVHVVHGRLESFSPEGPIDIVISRAFTQLRQMTAWLVHPDLQSAKLLAMKGQLPQAEIEALPAPWVVERIDRLQVPFLEEARHLLVLSKTERNKADQ